MDGLTVVLLLCLAAAATCMEKMVMQRARMEDQESSATGYAYSSGSPSYMHYADASGGMVDVEVPYAFDYLPPYEYQHLPVVDSSMHYVPQLHEDSHYHHYGYPSSQNIIEHNKVKYGFDKPWNFGENEGSKHENEHHESHGEKGDKGFKKLLGWDQANKGYSDKENHKGWYGVEGGNKKGHHDAEEHWQAKEAEGKAEKGEKFKEEKGQKKGAKTSGYHKVYRKDEFKKDHEFYDHADKKGYFNKYANFDAKHSKDQGAYEKGGHQKYGYHADEQGKKGFHDKGRHEDADHAHKAEHGGSNFHKNYEEFVKKAGEANAKKYEYNDGNGAKWKF